MRIVGGKFKGRSLKAPKSDATRPTTDRTRESLFNILENRIVFDGIRVLDLFAGTGALGLEACSRGAEFALFVEMGSQARGIIRDNVEVLGLNGHTKIFKRDATRLGELKGMEPFDLVFMDPPYGKKLGERAAVDLMENQWLAKNALLVLEESGDAAPTVLAGYEKVDQREFGSTTIGFFKADKDS